MKLGSNSDFTIGNVNRNTSRRLRGRGRGETRERQIAKEREAQRKVAQAKAVSDEKLRKQKAEEQKDELKISAVTQVTKREVDKNLDGTPVTQKQKVVNAKPYVEPVVTRSVVVGRSPATGSRSSSVDDIALAQGRKLEATKNRAVPQAIQSPQPISRASPDMVETTLLSNDDPLDDNVSSIARPTQTQNETPTNAYGTGGMNSNSLRKYLPVLLFYGALYGILRQGRFI